MARREWADKVKIPRYVLSDMSEDESSNMMPHPNGAWTYYHDSLSLARKEHARAVRIVKAEIKRVHMDERNYGIADQIIIVTALERVLAALMKGRA